MNKQNKAIIYAVLAAALYALNTPISKVLLEKVPATMMAAFLYLGAGIGIFFVSFVKKVTKEQYKELPLTKSELPYTIGMIVLDIAAPIFLMIGLTMTTAANASLLNNFEIVATSLIALVIFKEPVSKRLWIAIVLVTISSIILSFEGASSFSFSLGSIFVLLACICWGFENNCTKMLSKKNPLQIVEMKGIFSGTGSLIIAFLRGEKINDFSYIPAVMLLGFVAYGLSILFYIYAQRELGAAKTSTYYAVAPFIGVILSFMIFWNVPTKSFIVACLIMAVGTYIASTDEKNIE